MAWLILVITGMMEAVWATALSASNGFRRTVPTIVFLLALVVSMAGLAYAMTELPTGTAYAVWVGIGAALTVGYAILSGDEAPSAWKIVFITGIIASVVGLKLLPHQKPIGEHHGRGIPVVTGHRSGLNER